MKFPYGISDFGRIVSENYYYRDRSGHIPLIEEAGPYLLFIRPRRFGKSLLLSMLANYYDVARKDEFNDLFGHLKIGAQPTGLKNRFFILRLDFSCVDPMGTAEDIRRALHNHVNASIRSFGVYYEKFNLRPIELNPDDALVSMRSLIDAVRETAYPVYLLIDEYDNFANEVMMSVRRDREGIYQALVYEEGPLKTLFKAIKSSTADSVFDRIFVTGVTPVVMSDITSGYNIAENIYHDPLFNDLCGFTEEEIHNTLESMFPEDEKRVREAFEMMQTFYNGYIFGGRSQERMFNPTLAIYFFKQLVRTGQYPQEMLDENLAADDAKLQYVSELGGGQLLLDLAESDRPVAIDKLERRFGIKQVIDDQSHDYRFIVSFLYYFGVVTLQGETATGEMVLGVPNLVVRGLFIERIRQMLLPEPKTRDLGRQAGKRLYAKGDMQPVCDFVENHYFKVFRNRDYKWANELTVKTAFLTLLYNDTMYIMDSEPEIARGHADLTMIVRPDKRRFEILDILIEFKFVKLGEAGLTGEAAGRLDDSQLRQIPAMKTKMEEACVQARRYGDALQRLHGNLRLKRFAAVALGFERLWWQNV